MESGVQTTSLGLGKSMEKRDRSRRAVASAQTETNLESCCSGCELVVQQETSLQEPPGQLRAPSTAQFLIPGFAGRVQSSRWCGRCGAPGLVPVSCHFTGLPLPSEAAAGVGVDPSRVSNLRKTFFHSVTTETGSFAMACLLWETASCWKLYYLTCLN